MRHKSVDVSRRKQTRTDKILLSVFACAFIGLMGWYINRALYYRTHYIPATFINGVEYSNKTPDNYVSDKRAAIQRYSLTVTARECEPERITAGEIDLDLKNDEEAVLAVAKQNPWLWPVLSFTDKKYEFADELRFDADKLGDRVDSLACVAGEQRAPQDASWRYNKSKQEFEVVPEDEGTTVERNEVYRAVANCIGGMTPELDLTQDERSYKQPSVFSDDKNLNKAVKKGNKLLAGTVTYTIHDGVVKVDANKIRRWVKLNTKKGKATLNESKIQSFLKELGWDHDTLSAPYKVHTQRGDTVTLSGYYGWRIDRDAELKALVQDIKKGKHKDREPKYSHRGEGGSENPFGTTYAEVDLSNQRMYLIKNGKQAMSSSVVTGNTSVGEGTPTGIYRISYKDRNAVLRGPRLSNGQYSYESPVSYWMPFNQGIGFHDATWRSSFGGSIYKTDGSHGCVNMPYSKAKELYDYVYAGMVVLVYN